MVPGLPPTRCVSSGSRACRCAERQTRSDGSPLASVRVRLALKSLLLLSRPANRRADSADGCLLGAGSSGASEGVATAPECGAPDCRPCGWEYKTAPMRAQQPSAPVAVADTRISRYKRTARRSSMQDTKLFETILA